MEFSFDVNTIIPDQISLISTKDIAIHTQNFHFTSHTEKNAQAKKNLAKVIDAVGEASARAQDLQVAITSALRLKNSDHHLYILKAAVENNDFGSVIGIIKVGRKRLFLADVTGQLHECQPLCVLDFYIHESKQRHGYGKQLFEHMIETENVRPEHLAIDRPSMKFVNFLQKHYKLEQPIQQMNKYVVFRAFFKDLSAVGVIIDVNRRRSAPGRRNMYLKFADSRNVQSATNSPARTNRTAQHGNNITNQLSKFQLIPPIARTDCSGNGNDIQSSDVNSLLTSTRSVGHHNTRKTHVTPNDINLSSYSRHATKDSSASLPTTVKSRDHPCRPLHTHNTRTHTILPDTSNRNITSLDNPFSSNRRSNHDCRSGSTKNEVNMSDNGMGTSWNIFGVPSSTSLSRYPYTRM